VGKSNGGLVTPFLASSVGNALSSVANGVSLTMTTTGTITFNVGATGSVSGMQSTWWTGTPGATYYVRAKWISSSGTISPNNMLAGLAINTYSTWQALSANKTVGGNYGAASTGAITCVVQIASDAAGTTILATSYDIIMSGTSP
jgi:hypothetical protein